MTRTEYQALFPEFSATTYNDRIDALLPVLTPLDTAKAGVRLNLALGLELSDLLAAQDITIKYGSAAASAASSTSSEKRVGEVSVKTSLSQSASNGLRRPGQTTYGARYEALLREFGIGAVAV